MVKKETHNGKEFVYARSLHEPYGDILLDYPRIMTSRANKYLLAIYPEYHTRLFPDSKLVNESPDIVKDISHANSIHKIYICGMRSVMGMKEEISLSSIEPETKKRASSLSFCSQYIMCS